MSNPTNIIHRRWLARAAAKNPVSVAPVTEEKEKVTKVRKRKKTKKSKQKG